MKRLKMKTLIVVLLVCMAPFTLKAKVTMPPLFSDNMVLQQQSNVAIWGWTDSRTEVTVETSWNNKSYKAKSDKDGKWKVIVETPVAGGPYEIDVSDGTPQTLKNVLIGEVWLCSGQSNMEMPMKGFPGQPVLHSNMDILKSTNDNLRLISVPRTSKTVPQDNFKGEWEKANPESVSNFSATAYYYGRLLQQLLDVPVGLIDVSFGGSCIQAWMSKNTSVSFEDKKVPEADDTIKVPNRTPIVLFNGMLHPVIGYGIKGCIWYQGETNYIESNRYEELFPTMVKEWRSLWGEGDFPFYYMQIAPFDYSVFTPTEFHEKYNSAYLRDAQRKSIDKIPNCDMAVLMDIGEKENIHPTNKQVGGERLAVLALAETYGMEGFVSKSPLYSDLEIQGSTVVVSFNNVKNGLTSFEKKLNNFEIAGKDKHFYPANAVLLRKSVLVSSPNVTEPVAVRYAFKNFVVGDLFGTAGLPVSSFRTDDW